MRLILNGLQILVQFLDKFLEDAFKHIDAVEHTFFVSDIVEFDCASEFLIFDDQVSNAMLAVVVFVWRNEQRGLTLIFQERFLEVSVDIVLVGSLLPALLGLDRPVLDFDFVFLLDLPCFQQRIRAEVDEDFAQAPVLFVYLELHSCLEALDELRVHFPE